ncbi:MAG: phosphoribosylformylglycinamidine synthase subunit PurQ, partial [Coriobacteriales bacterium]|nr:phosphoribosylformylglycinamidine synthase subunit PurQ [Coriobacteriales bacterium]
VESVSRLVAAGFQMENTYLTFQEYFGKLKDVPERWGKPAGSLLGALMAQVDLGVGSIGGKDSMSGSFEDLDVPPTLVSFATAVGSIERVTSPEFKKVGSPIICIQPAYPAQGLIPTAQGMNDALALVEELIGDGAALSVSACGYGSDAEAIFKMCVGNGIGAQLDGITSAEQLFQPAYGSFVVELGEDIEIDGGEFVSVTRIGTTTAAYVLEACGETISLAQLQEAWEAKMEPVFPYRTPADAELPAVEKIDFVAKDVHVYGGDKIARPRVIIPVFPGNNCEFDSARAFRRAGAQAETLVINNLTPNAVAESVEALVKAINNSQIVMIPGGFSGGDEPDGSAKFITAFFRNPAVTEAVRDLLNNRDGLMLGICNGCQALVKLGLVPYGYIVPMTPECATLTFNNIGRHQSRLVRTRVASNLSPWL